MSRWRHALAIIALPGAVTVLGPSLALADRGPRFAWGLGLPAALLVALAGFALIAGGLLLFTQTALLFAHAGKGTLAPWDPTRQLVITGPYRRTRNPMITAVAAILLGEVALLGSPSLIVYLLAFFAINHAYFILSEEPRLAERFGDPYRRYKQAVPRWIPRKTPYPRT
jgi:protein-S-isoprenylcysteine O-methyltransferase Ste14